MESAGNDTIRGIQKTLEPYIRPREEVTRIRQILAAHLDSCLGDGDASGPLALADATKVAPSKAARGLQKEYLEALGANIKARAEFAAQCRDQRRSDEEAGRTISGDQGADRLQEHLAVLRLRQRREKLQVIERGLNSLEQKPAASPSFLDPAEIFRDSRPLPSVPRELLTALTIDKAAAGPDLKDLIDQLERHVLQTKLLLQREEKLLETVKARSTARPDNISQHAKLVAIDTTRTELINWMEAELGKASGDDGDADGHDSHKHRAPPAADSVNMEEQLASIKEKYTQYLDARKTLLHLVSQQPQPVIKPPTRETAAPPPPKPTPQPTAHLLTPYLSHLLTLAHEQKSQIAQKSHLTASLTNQLRETTQLLSHLSDESQLLPSHPMPGAPPPAARSNAAFPPSADSSSSNGPSARVRPWVFAADSAKIATLEAVAEKIEEGQVALEGTVRTLGEMEEMLGQPPGATDGGRNGEEDVWLAEGQQQQEGRMVGGRRHTLRQRGEVVPVRTVWDLLDGGLGLIGGEKEVV